MITCSVITARGGSKGVPGKNLRPAGGKPLIAWTIEAARSARQIDRVIVSTDSEEIRAVALQCGAEAPFLRPAELAQDNTPGVAPVIHAAQWLAQHQNYSPDCILLLQPTSPFRGSEDIDNSTAMAVNAISFRSSQKLECLMYQSSSAPLYGAMSSR